MSNFEAEEIRKPFDNTMRIPEKDSRIIFSTELGELGGAERSCLALANWLHRQGIPNHFLTYRDPAEIAQFADHPLITVELKPEMRVARKVASLRRYMQRFASSPYKMLTSGVQSALHTTLAAQCGFHTLMHDTPSLYGNRGNPKGIKARLRAHITNSIVGYGLRGGGATIVTSQYLQKESQDVYHVSAHIARMGGMAQNCKFRLRPATSELRMLSVSRLEDNKRIDWVLRALSALEHSSTKLSSSVEWQFDIAGKGSQHRQLQALAYDLGIADRVHLYGFVSDARLAELYDAAHLFLMPAVQGYGIPAAEAMYRGIPVLLHRESGISDIFLDTPWATVVHGGEESLLPALTEAIQGVLTGRHNLVPPPSPPTEDQWAERVATLCNWI